VKQYLDLLQDILGKGIESTDRTGTGTLRKFGHQMRFNLQDGFPLLTTKKLHLKSVIHELLWFLSGSTNIKYLHDNGVTIWDSWADEARDLGPAYGKQWRSWDGHADAELPEFFGENPTLHVEKIDQIQNALDMIINRPDDRGIIVTAWNPADIKDVRLRWCHCLFQFVVLDGKLSCQLYQRSADTFLGLPFNIASYALLAHMFAQQADLEVGDFVWTGGDVHLYLNHIEQAKLQLSRDPRSLPELRLNKADSLFCYQIEDFEFVGYNPHPAIKADVSV